LVFISALAPDVDAGETPGSILKNYPASPVFQYVEPGDGRLWLSSGGIKCFAGDLPQQEQNLAYATQFAPDANLFARNAPGVAWKTKPGWYIVTPTSPKPARGHGDAGSFASTYARKLSAIMWNRTYGCGEDFADVLPPLARSAAVRSNLRVTLRIAYGIAVRAGVA
jgi:hypothetical protein